MKGIATWMWVIGGLLITMLLVTLFFSILTRIITEKHKQDSRESFSSMVNTINSLCDMNKGEKVLKTVAFSDMVNKVYVLGETGGGVTRFGKYLCINITGETSCEKTNCVVEMESLVGEETLLGLVDRLMGRYGYREYKLQFTRTECGVSVLEPGMQPSCPCNFEGWDRPITCEDNGMYPVLLARGNFVILTDITSWIDSDANMLTLSKNIANYFGGEKILIIWEDSIVDPTFPKTALESNGFEVSVFRHTSTLPDLSGYDQIWILNPGWCEHPARATSPYCTGVKIWDSSEVNLIVDAARNNKGIFLLTDSGVIRGRYTNIELNTFNNIINSYGLSFIQAQGCRCGCGNLNAVLATISPHPLVNGINEFKVKAVAKFSCMNI